MSNLTITIDSELLRRARIRALEHGTSVNALVRAYLEAFAGAEEARAAIGELVVIARTARSRSGARGRQWTREDLHER